MKTSVICLVLVLGLLLTGCGAASAVPETAVQEFTDSTGRTVTLPAEITSIAVTGPQSQLYILPLAGDMLVGLSSGYAPEAAKYLPEYLLEKPEIGQLYGGKGEMDLEALLSAAPDVVIDIGEAKDTLTADLDALTKQTGIPFIHVDATVATAPETYRTLGKLLGREEQGEKLALWCEETYSEMERLMEAVDADGARKSILYCLGDSGTFVIAKDSFHAETINMMGNNVAVVEDVVHSGMGNEVDLEQLLVWNPDVILFAPDSIYDSVGQQDGWQGLSAIAAKNYYQTPYGPYGWLSAPPSVQQYLGMVWLGNLLYPNYVNYNLQDIVTEYYSLFYSCDLTDEMYHTLMEGAMS